MYVVELTDEQRNRISEALQQRGATRECPRCGNDTFALVGGYFVHTVQQNFGGLVLGGPNIPTAVVVCNKCGWLAEHALGALGLLPTPAPTLPKADEPAKPMDGVK